MFVIDKPLLPKYSKASLNSLSSGSSGFSSASSNICSLRSQDTVTTVITSGAPKPNGKTISRANSASSLGRPYATNTLEPTHQRRKSRSAPDKKAAAIASSTNCVKNVEKLKKGRQWSADSGVDTLGFNEETIGDVDASFILPPRITSYAESECYLMNLPRCDQFATHLARNLKPLLENFKLGNRKDAKDTIRHFANKLHRLAQESVIAFPRSANTANNSPRFQEFLRIAVEKYDRAMPVLACLY